MRAPKWIVIGIISVGVFAGCNGQKQPKELPEARPLLEESTDKIQNAQSFGLEIGVSGYPVDISSPDFPLPVDAPLLFQYAKGFFVAPDRLQAGVQVALGKFGTTIELIAVGQDQYMRSSLLTQNRWLQQEIIADFSPAALLSPDRGIRYALNTITDLEMMGEKDIDGRDVFALRGTIEAQNVYSLTFGLVSTQTGQIQVEIHILVNERLIDQVILHEPLPPGVTDQEPTTWTISFMDYNKPVSISAPSVEN
jgi:hypothetical protein